MTQVVTIHRIIAERLKRGVGEGFPLIDEFKSKIGRGLQPNNDTHGLCCVRLSCAGSSFLIWLQLISRQNCPSLKGLRVRRNNGVCRRPFLFYQNLPMEVGTYEN